MTQMEAACILRDCFYEQVPSKAVAPSANFSGLILMFRRDSGELMLPTRVSSEELTKRKDDLIGKEFRFTWPPPPSESLSA